MSNRMVLWSILVVLAVTLFIPASQAADLTCTDVGSAVDQGSAYPFPGFDEKHHAEYCGTEAWYALDLVAGHGYTIILQAHMVSGELDFGLYEADGVTEVEDSDDSRIANGEIGIAEKTAARTGRYYLRVFQYGSAVTEGNYDLAVYNAWFNPGVSDSDRDYFQSQGTTRYAVNGTYAVEDILSDHPHWYRFAAAPGAAIEVALTAHLGQGELNFDVLSSKGQILAGSSNNYIGNGETGTAAAEAARVSGGVYFIRVVQSSGDPTGTYDLVITGALPDGDGDGDGLFDAAEHWHGTDLGVADTDADGVNDYDELAAGSDPLAAHSYVLSETSSAVSMATALAVPYMDSPFSCEHPTNTQSDTGTWYALDLVAGQGISVLLAGQFDIGVVRFGIYNSAGQEIKSVGNDSIGDGGLGLVELVVDETGTYYIKVWEYRDFGASAVTGRYRLAVYNAWFNPGVVDSQRDYYRSQRTARYAVNGTYAVEDILSDHPHWYRFAAAPGAAIEVALTAHLGQGELNFDVLSSKGQILAGSSNNYIGNGETGTAAAEAARVSGGVYFIRVVQSSGDPTGTYDLVITGALPDGDGDGDGLFDAAEHWHGTDLGVADTDADGVNDYDELAAGSDPLAAHSYVLSETSSAVSMATALAVPYMDSPFSCEHPTNTQSDTGTWYALDLVAGQGISVLLAGQFDIGVVRFGIYNSAGQEIKSVGNDSIGDGGLGLVELVVDETGTYYIKVWEYRDFGASAVTGRYRLAVYNAWFNPGVVDSQRDYYRSQRTARYAVNGTYAVEDILSDHPHWYRFAAAPGAAIEVALTAHLGQGELNFDVLSSKGQILAGSSNNYIGNGETGTAAAEAARVSGGVYFIRVVQSSGDPTGTYDLVITGALPDGDGDGDGLFDAAEHWHGTDLGVADTDADGVNDYDELAAGSDPLAAHSYVLSETSSAVSMATALAVPYMDSPFSCEHPTNTQSDTGTWYALDLVAGQGISVLLAGQFDIGVVRFGIYNSAGQEIKSVGNDSIGDGGLGLVELVVDETGTYYIKVWEYRDFGASAVTGRYRLAVYNAWFNPGVVDSQRDYYRSQRTARYAVNGTYAVEDILSDHPHWYRFAAAPGAAIEVALTAHLGQGELNFDVLSSKGQILAGSSNNYIGNGETGTAAAEAARVSGGVYFIRVVQSSGDPTGTYDLVITGALPDGDGDGDGLFDAAEHWHGTDLGVADTDADGVNDYDELAAGSDPLAAHSYVLSETSSAVSMATALAVPYMDSPFSCEHPTNTQSDTGTWYALDLVAGQGISVLLAGQFDIGVVRFGIYNSAGQEIKSVGNDSIGDGGLGLVELVVDETGTYYIKVWEYRDFGASAVTGRYRLAVYNAWFNPGVVDSQRDYYASYYTARYVSNGSFSLNRYGDNYFRFNAEAGTQIDVSVTSHLNVGSLHFGIFNESYAEIGGSNITYIQDGQTGTASVSITQAGVYYLRVWENRSAYGHFDLSISGHEAIPIIQVVPSSFNFGSVNTGEYANSDFTITNQGDFDLSVGDITIEGDPDFTLVSDGCSQQVLSHQQTCTFRVRFAPAGAGDKSATVHIPSSDPDRPVFDIPLTAAGVVVTTDSDADGVPDDIDNCPDVPNADQADLDGDGIGNLCDPDVDGDGILNDEDPDDDNDEMTDDCESQYASLNPFDPTDAAEDFDGDGLINSEECFNNTDPDDPDSDDDDISDGDEVHHGNDPNGVDEVSLEIQGDDVLVSLTGDNKLFVRVFNRFCILKPVQFLLSGLDPAWYTISPEDQNFTLLPFGAKTIPVQLHLPSDCSIATGSHPFEVMITWEHDGVAYDSRDQGNLVITPNPNIYQLAVSEDTRLAGNTILAAWRTDIPAESTLFYRKLDEETYTEVPVAANVTEHLAVIEDLDWFMVYEFYTETTSSCGGYIKNGPYIVKTGKAVKFANNVNEFWIDRDYNQLVTMTVTNTDVIKHTYQLSVINDNDDLAVDFVGDGSNGRQATLQPGESTQVELVFHAPDAQKTEYDILLKMVSDGEEFGAFVDYSHAVVHVRPFVANMELQPVASTPGMMTYNLNLVNYGDALSNIEVYTDEGNRSKIWMEQEYHHFRLESGASVPIILHAQEYTTGTIYARSGDYVVSSSFEIGCPDGTSLNTYTLNDVPMAAQIKDWYCTNKQELHLPFSFPSGFGKNNIQWAYLQVDFYLPMALEKYDPHTVTIYINDQLVERWENTIPDGRYQIRFPGSFINTGLSTPAQNYLTLVAEGVSPGQYIVATDFIIALHVDQMTVDLCVEPPGTGPGPYTPPDLGEPPPPRTKIIQVGPKEKYRPGDSVPVFVALQNNDNKLHEGTLVVTLANDSYNGQVPEETFSQEVVISGGRQLEVRFDALLNQEYLIPEDADDIDYRISAVFHNQTLGETVQVADRPVFWVRTPLIILHGIMGSELSQGDQSLWNPLRLGLLTCDNAMDQLVCGESGVPQNPDIQATNVIKNYFRLAPFGIDFFVYGDIFHGLEQHLEAKKYRFHSNGSDFDHPFHVSTFEVDSEQSEDVFYYIYDWRQTNIISAESLSGFINNLITKIKTAEQTEYGKVNILAHSMGGLVVKNLLADPVFDTSKIKKSIFVGAPNIGAVDAFALLKYGYGAPWYDQPVEVDAIERAEQMLGRLNLVADAYQGVSGDGFAAVSVIIGIIEELVSTKNPEFCDEGFEIYKQLMVLKSTVKLLTPAAALEAMSITGELMHLFNLDRDGNKMRDSQVAKLSKNMASAYQLLPSDRYFDLNAGGFFEINDVSLNDPAAMEEMLFSWLIRIGDFIDPAEFIFKLKQPQDSLADYILGQLSVDTITMLDAYAIGAPIPQEMLISIIYDLNIMIGGPNLYDNEPFQNIELSFETTQLLQLNPQGDELVQLNRLLLQDAFPHDFSKRKVFNESLYNSAKAMHTEIDGMAMPGQSYAIVGCKRCTAGSIREDNSPVELEFVSIDGDGTVPLPSALEIDVTRKYAVKYAKHDNLPSNRGSRLLISSLLKGYEEDFETDILNPVEEYSEGCCGKPICQTSKISLTKDGEIPELVICDENDDCSYFGPNGISIGIVGSDFILTDEGVEIYVPEGSAYVLEFKGVDKEYLDIKYRMMTDGGVNNTYVFAELQLDVDGCGEVLVDLTNIMLDPVVRLDQGCNGSYEQDNIPPSDVLDETEASDFIAPVTTHDINGTEENDDWYSSNVTVTLSATDTGGSGLLATRYRFAGDAVFTDYSSPIQITELGEHTLTYFSIDRNLNKEVERSVTIKIDPEQPQVLNVTDSGYFNLGLADITATLEISVGISGLQEVQYSVGTAPAQTDIRGWTSAGTSTALNTTGLSLVENCVDQIYVNVRVINGAGVESEVVSSDGVIMLEPGGDPDADGFINEEEIAAESSPCNENSIPKDTTITLSPGFNMVAIPAEVMFRPDLRDWIPLIGSAADIDRVMVYDSQNQHFIIFYPGAQDNPSYTLQGGEALIVVALNEVEVSFTSALCNPMTLNQGLNFIGFACSPNSYTAFDLATLIGTENVSGIQRFNTETGLFETLSIDSNGNQAGFDFEIIVGEGYFVHAQNPLFEIELP